MKSEKKVFKHGFVNKLPFVAAFLLMLFGFIFIHAIGDQASNIIGAKEGTLMANLSNTVGVALIALLLLVLFTRWFYPEFAGFFKKDGFAQGAKLLIPFYAVWVVWYIIENIIGLVQFNGDIVGALVSGLNAGIVEEIVFRGLAVTLLLRGIKKESRIITAPIFVGIVFGCVHLFNLTSPDYETVEVIAGMIFASAVGVVFGFIYTMSGNLWNLVIVHALYDAATFVFEHKESTNWANFIDLGIMLVMTVGYIIYYKKNKDAALEVWNDRWQEQDAQ